MNIKITATASGSLTPPMASDVDVPNGDFLIINNSFRGLITGDGLDEATEWTFDFAGDPNFPLFSPLRPLTSALLTLTLTPVHEGVTTDAVRIETLPFIYGPPISTSPVGETKPVLIQLLEKLGYTSSAILGILFGGSGKIPMHYNDDAIVSSAKLELIQESPALQYAAKVVCGKSTGKVVAPGVYFTAINIHNPTYTAIRFRFKIAVALPGLTPGPVSKFFDVTLGPDQALEIDSPDIFKFTETEADFLKGFVVIESDVELDVVAVYTAAGDNREVTTLHTERVPPRSLELALPDLIPAPDANGSFCRRHGSTFMVTVKNQGTGGAGPSVTEVDFIAFGKFSMPTPPLGPGASVDLAFPIQPGCFDPDCEFQITVDANKQVTESNEGNNIARGSCLG